MEESNFTTATRYVAGEVEAKKRKIFEDTLHNILKKPIKKSKYYSFAHFNGSFRKKEK